MQALGALPLQSFANTLNRHYSKLITIVFHFPQAPILFTLDKHYKANGLHPLSIKLNNSLERQIVVILVD